MINKNIFLWLFCIGLTTTFAQTELNFEAETGQLGGSRVEYCHRASNGASVVLHINETVQFNNVQVSKAGLYELDIVYFAKYNSVAQVSVNNSVQATTNLKPTGAYCWQSGGVTKTITTQVVLNAGSNKLLLKNINGAGGIVDRLSLRLIKPYVILEAETGQLAASGRIENCHRASNGASVVLHRNATVQFNSVQASETGLYELDITYFAKGNTAVQVFVNNSLQVAPSLSATGSYCWEGNSVKKTVTTQVVLNAGSNKLLLKSIGGSAVIVDKLVLKLKTPYTTLEAETGQLAASGRIENCHRASNGASVVLHKNAIVQFNNVQVSESGTYEVYITYFAKGNTATQIFVNNSLQVTQSLSATGSYCWESSSVSKTATTQVVLNAGSNKILLKSIGGSAAIVDKLVLKLVSTNRSRGQKAEVKELVNEEQKDEVKEVEFTTKKIIAYPNPSKNSFALSFNIIKDADVSYEIIDLKTNRVLQTNHKKFVKGDNEWKIFTDNLPKGIYTIKVATNGRKEFIKIILE